MKNKGNYIKRMIGTGSSRLSVRAIILISYSLTFAAIMSLLGILLYVQFVQRMKAQMTSSTSQLTERVVSSLEDYLTGMRRLSDSLYYEVIKEKDFSSENADAEMTVLYEANSDNLVSLALYSHGGTLISAAPTAVQKQNLDVTRESWFTEAVARPENNHFSIPHVQDIFDNRDYQYHWVISLSRAVELTINGRPRDGVLLVDMNFSSIEQMLNEVNGSGSYYSYLTDSDGRIIYHPQMMQIYAGVMTEDNAAAARLEDGVHNMYLNNENRVVIVDTVSYTGWKMISVIPESAITIGANSIKYYILVIVALLTMMMLIINRLIADNITEPLEMLDDSMDNSGVIAREVYDRGSREVVHLARTLEAYKESNDRLMKDIVTEQEEKRRMELAALQSQINPHFLYNTLDSIVWMIEGEQYKGAVSMITQLARVFRISLSQGKTIIPIGDELQHAANYMNIQAVRFKNKFTVIYDLDESLNGFSTVKLILQPILENAIYYGVKDMDEDGEIRVRTYRDNDEIIMSVQDNGFGMMPQEAAHLLDEDRSHIPHRGSGVGLYNVHKRIQLMFGEQYGLTIETEPDMGMKVMVHLPVIPYSEAQALNGREDRKNEVE